MTDERLNVQDLSDERKHELERELEKLTKQVMEIADEIGYAVGICGYPNSPTFKARTFGDVRISLYEGSISRTIHYDEEGSYDGILSTSFDDAWKYLTGRKYNAQKKEARRRYIKDE